MKKLLFLSALLICVFLCFGCSSIPKDTGDFVCSFDKTEKTVTILEYKGNDTDIVIPEFFEKYKVTKIGSQAFNENYEITSITLPESIEVIEFQAFRLCVSLESITLPESLTTIENAVFADCRSLKEITIPKNTTNIGLSVFTNCNSLEKFTVEKGNTVYSADEYGVLIRNGMTLIQYPAASEYISYTIPDGITEISVSAFANTENLEDVTFPKSLETIETKAFEKSAITKAVLGDKIETIGSSAFSESSLTEINLGNSVKTIENNAFAYCLISEFDIPSSLTKIGRYAFEGCSSLEKFTVDKDNSFYIADENGVLFTKNMNILLNYPSANIAEEYIIPSGTKTIADSAFKNNIYLKKIIIPDSVETIESHAFGSCIYLKDMVYEGTKPSNISENAFE